MLLDAKKQEANNNWLSLRKRLANSVFATFFTDGTASSRV